MPLPFFRRKVNPRTYFSYKKSRQKNFPTNASVYFGENFLVSNPRLGKKSGKRFSQRTRIYLGKSFLVSKELFTKSSLVRVPRRTAPTDNSPNSYQISSSSSSASSPFCFFSFFSFLISRRRSSSSGLSPIGISLIFFIPKI